MYVCMYVLNMYACKYIFQTLAASAFDLLAFMLLFQIYQQTMHHRDLPYRPPCAKVETWHSWSSSRISVTHRIHGQQPEMSGLRALLTREPTANANYVPLASDAQGSLDESVSPLPEVLGSGTDGRGGGSPLRSGGGRGYC